MQRVDCKIARDREGTGIGIATKQGLSTYAGIDRSTRPFNEKKRKSTTEHSMHIALRALVGLYGNARRPEENPRFGFSCVDKTRSKEGSRAW